MNGFSRLKAKPFRPILLGTNNSMVLEVLTLLGRDDRADDFSEDYSPSEE
jgi:hypothetical protein